MRTYLLLLTWLVSLTVAAQQKIHVAERGETFATIASKYGTTVEALQKANPYLKKLYTGIEVKIPSGNSAGISGTGATDKPMSGASTETSVVAVGTSNTESISRPAQAYIDYATEYMKAGNHKKAIKELDKSLEMQETMQAYWLRGRCYYYEQKWKKAAQDLEVVMNSSQMDNESRQEAGKMYTYALEQQETKRQERAEFWSKAAAGTLLVAAAVGTAAIQRDMMKSSAAAADLSSSSAAPSAGISSDSSSGGLANSQAGYQRIYDTKAGAAEDLFKALSNGNTRFVDKNGIQKGAKHDMTSGVAAASYSTLKPKLDRVQRELVSIRQEAERKGFKIIPSKYETATLY